MSLSSWARLAVGGLDVSLDGLGAALLGQQHELAELLDLGVEFVGPRSRGRRNGLGLRVLDDGVGGAFRLRAAGEDDDRGRHGRGEQDHDGDDRRRPAVDPRAVGGRGLARRGGGSGRGHGVARDRREGVAGGGRPGLSLRRTLCDGRGLGGLIGRRGLGRIGVCLRRPRRPGGPQ